MSAVGTVTYNWAALREAAVRDNLATCNRTSIDWGSKRVEDCRVCPHFHLPSWYMNLCIVVSSVWLYLLCYYHD